MGKQLDLKWFLEQFRKKSDFEVSEKTYEEVIGKGLPSTNYIRYGSPLSKAAKEAGFRIEVEERPVIQRTLVFRYIQK